MLSVIDYLERMPDKLITRKQELIENLKNSAMSQAAAETQKGGGGFALGSELDAAKKIAQLPASMQAKYNNLPKAAQRILTK